MSKKSDKNKIILYQIGPDKVEQTGEFGNLNVTFVVPGSFFNKGGVNPKDLALSRIVEETGNHLAENAREQEEKEKSRGWLKIIPLVLVLIPFTIGLKACVDQHKCSYTYTLQHDVRPPQDYAIGHVGEYGQEELTNVKISGDESHYNEEEHAAMEAEAIEGYDEFMNNKQIVADSLAILENEDASMKEKEQALRDMNAALQEMKEAYEAKQRVMKDATSGFIDASQVYPDSRTNDEIKVLKDNLKAYYGELGISQDNAEAIGKLVEAMDNDGLQISNIKIEDILGKAYRITVEGCIRAAADNINGLSDLDNIKANANEIEVNYNNEIDM